MSRTSGDKRPLVAVAGALTPTGEKNAGVLALSCRIRKRVAIAIFVLGGLLSSAVPAAWAEELISNGDFAMWKENRPAHWRARIAGSLDSADDALSEISVNGSYAMRVETKDIPASQFLLVRNASVDFKPGRYSCKAVVDSSNYFGKALFAVETWGEGLDINLPIEREVRGPQEVSFSFDVPPDLDTKRFMLQFRIEGGSGVLDVLSVSVTKVD